MDFGVTWNWLESYLYCLLNLGNSFTSEPCVWIEWDDKHKTPAHHSFSSLMIYDVVWSHWLAFPPLFRVFFFWELVFLWVAFLKFMLLKHKILSQTNDKIIPRPRPKKAKYYTGCKDMSHNCRVDRKSPVSSPPIPSLGICFAFCSLYYVDRSPNCPVIQH